MISTTEMPVRDIAAKTLAAMDARDYLIPDDVKAAALPVLRHRLLVKPEADLEGITPDQVVAEVLERVLGTRQPAALQSGNETVGDGVTEVNQLHPAKTTFGRTSTGPPSRRTFTTSPMAMS